MRIDDTCVMQLTDVVENIGPAAMDVLDAVGARGGVQLGRLLFPQRHS